MSEEKVDRRGYVKYAAAGVIVIAGAAAGAYYATRPGPPTTPGPPQTITATETEVRTVTGEEPTGPFEPPLGKYTWEEEPAKYYNEIDPTCERLYFYSDWACFSSPTIEHGYLTETGVKEVVTDVYPDEMDMFAKIKAGGHGYDLLHLHYVTDPNDPDREGGHGIWREYQFSEEPLLAPIDMDIMSNYVGKDMFPSREFWEKTSKWDDGNFYTIPQEMFMDSVSYNTDYVTDEEAQSLAVLWNPKFKNKIAMPDYGIEALAVCGAYTGAKVPWNQTPEELEVSYKAALEQKKLIRAYWGTAGDFETLMASKEIYVGHNWWACIQPLAAIGFPIGWSMVDEGMMIGACHHAIAAETKYPYECNLWMNYNFSAERGARLYQACKHPPIAKHAYRDTDVFTPYIHELWGLEDLPSTWAKGHYYSYPVHADLYLKYWAEVKAA